MEQSNLPARVQQAQEALKKYWYVPALVILLMVLFLLGSWYGQKKVGAQNSAGNRRILYYVDPMNPTHTSPEPGLAPCGMKMEPVYADDGGQTAGSAMPPGFVKITPEKQQIIGVRVAAVEKSPWTHRIRTVGKVAVDETRTYRLNAFSEGFIMRVFDNSTGSLVRKDEPLATIYSKDLITALQTYFYAAHAVDSLTEGQQLPPLQIEVLKAQKQSAEYALMNLGMGSLQIQDLARRRHITQEIILNAPATGFVLARNITPGQKFTGGEELYRLADLSRVWILADLFKNEAKYVRPGEKVKVTLAGQEETHMATVSEVLPQFDPETLTLKVRLEVDNPEFALRPGMFMDVEFPINLPATVNVPADAIMDSGLKKTVFIERDKGFFEPRKVKTGWRLGDRVEVTEGLAPGERIVTSGNFLIDSESRMRLAAAGMFGEVTKDPVCGLNVDESKAKAAGFQSAYKNRTYYFCSPGCQQHFDKNPERYAAKPGGAQETAAGFAGDKKPAETIKAKDPVCGHEVNPAQAKVSGLTSDHEGKTYYFCSYACNRQFDKDPERYLEPSGRAVGGSHAGQEHAGPATVKDPVCGLDVAVGAAKQAGRTSEYQGKTYYFDTAGCKQRFDHAPQRYLSGVSEATLPQTYPNVPTDPNLLLRLRRDLIRAIPPGKGQEIPKEPTPGMPMESQVKPPERQTPPPLVPQASPVGPMQPQAPPQIHTPPPPQPQASPPASLPPSQAPPQLKAPELPTPSAPPQAPPHGGEHRHD